jgi:hypothetical protein
LRIKIRRKGARPLNYSAKEQMLLLTIKWPGFFFFLKEWENG